MLKDWTLFYLSVTGATLQVTLEAEKAETFESDELYSALYIYNKTYGYPLVALPGFPIRYDNTELLFPDGVVFILPPNTMFIKPGFTQYRTMLVENTIKHKMIVFEEVM